MDFSPYVDRPENTTLNDFLADLKDTGPDSPVDLRDPRYALAMLVDMSVRTNMLWAKQLGETVFASLKPGDLLPLDPEPWVVHSVSSGDWRTSSYRPVLGYRHTFAPRKGFSQDVSRYPEVNDGRG